MRAVGIETVTVPRELLDEAVQRLDRYREFGEGISGKVDSPARHLISELCALVDDDDDLVPPHRRHPIGQLLDFKTMEQGTDRREAR